MTFNWLQFIQEKLLDMSQKLGVYFLQFFYAQTFPLQNTKPNPPIHRSLWLECTLCLSDGLDMCFLLEYPTEKVSVKGVIRSTAQPKK